MNFRILNSGLADSGYLPRGSKIHWEGTVTAWASDVLTFGYATSSYLEEILTNAGFQADVNTRAVMASFNDRRVIVDAVTPVDYRTADDAFSTIKGAVWTAYQNEPRDISASVTSRPYVDAKTGNTYRPGAPVINAPPDTVVDNPNNPNRCGDKYGLQWVACQTGLDSTAQQLGLGIGAGVALLVVGGVVLLMILKK